MKTDNKTNASFPPDIGQERTEKGRLFVLKELNEWRHRPQVQTLRWELYGMRARLCTMGVCLPEGEPLFQGIIR